MSQALKVDQIDIIERLNRIPRSRTIWRIVILLSLGGLIEYYNISIIAYISPGLTKDGFFAGSSLGIFKAFGTLSIQGFGTFVFSSFFGIFVGTIAFGFFSDRLGRRAVFAYSMSAFAILNGLMACSTTGFQLNSFRFLAAVCIGIELVTIDPYICELVSPEFRGSAMAVNRFIQFCGVPLVAFFSWLFVPHQYFGYSGWRVVALIGSVGALIVWVLRLGLAESPRWLADHGRVDKADAIVRNIESRVIREGKSLPPPQHHDLHMAEHVKNSHWMLFSRRYRKRTIMLSLFNLFQTVGYFGFGAWVPTLLVHRGIHITQSLQYSFIIALANPIGPLAGALIADRFERKWQICTAASLMGLLILLFSISSGFWVILVGLAFTFCSNWLSYAFGTYQSELYPTSIRSTAIGFVYSWSRFSAAFIGFIIAKLIDIGGIAAVALFIAAAMAIVVSIIAALGPKTSGLSLEEIE